MKREFEKAFSPPFKMDSYISWVYDKNHNFCFQFQIDLSDTQRKQFEDVINGKVKPNNKNVYKHSNGFISVNGADIILMRGWGYLTGIGGLNLPDKEAESIQNDLANYIVDKLNAKEV